MPSGIAFSIPEIDRLFWGGLCNDDVENYSDSISVCMAHFSRFTSVSIAVEIKCYIRVNYSQYALRKISGDTHGR